MNGVFHILQNSRTETSPSDDLILYPEHSLERSYPFRDAVSVLYHLSQLSYKIEAFLDKLEAKVEQLTLQWSHSSNQESFLKLV